MAGLNRLFTKGALLFPNFSLTRSRDFFSVFAVEVDGVSDDAVLGRERVGVAGREVPDLGSGTSCLEKVADTMLFNTFFFSMLDDACVRLDTDAGWFAVRGLSLGFMPCSAVDSGFA